MTTLMGAGVVSVDGIYCWSTTLESTNCLTARLNRFLGYLSFKRIQSQADRIKFYVVLAEIIVYIAKRLKRAHVSETRRSLSISQSSRTRSRIRRTFHVFSIYSCD